MVVSDGKCRIDGVAIGELQVNTLGSGATITAKYAMCESSTGSRFGAGTRSLGWSDDTLARLRDLLDSMERDICRELFSGGTTAGGGQETLAAPGDDLPGL